MTPEKSFDIIAAMMAQTRRNVLQSSSLPFLVWGWATVAVGLAVYFAVSATGDFRSYLIWFSLPVIGAAAMVILRRRKSNAPRTVLDHPLNSIWKMFFWVMVVLSVCSFLVSFNIMFFILLILSIACYVTGAIIRYPLLCATSVYGFVADTVLWFVTGPRQILIFIAAIIVMMIFPGYKMRHDLRD